MSSSDFEVRFISANHGEHCFKWAGARNAADVVITFCIEDNVCEPGDIDVDGVQFEYAPDGLEVRTSLFDEENAWLGRITLAYPESGRPKYNIATMHVDCGVPISGVKPPNISGIRGMYDKYIKESDIAWRLWLELNHQGVQEMVDRITDSAADAACKGLSKVSIGTPYQRWLSECRQYSQRVDNYIVNLFEEAGYTVKRLPSEFNSKVVSMVELSGWDQPQPGIEEQEEDAWK